MTRLCARALPLVVAASLMLTVTAAPSEAHAQERTFSSATGWMWGVATFELTLGIGLLIVTTGDICESWGCGVLALLVGAVALGSSITAGLLAAGNDTPPDIPFAVHNTLWAALSGALGGFAFAKLFAATDSTATIAALSSAGVIGLGLGTYSAVRRDPLMRETRTSAAAHFIAWGVPLVGVGTLILLSSIDIPSEGAALLYALTTLISYGASIAWAETRIADDDVSGVTPMLSFSGTF